MNEGYDVAQICLNGHVINSTSKNMPEFNKTYCDKCGEATTTVCPNCKNPIQGDYWGGAVVFMEFPTPIFCIHCGKPFEWTLRKIKAAKEIAELSQSLNPEEIKELQSCIDELVKKSNVELSKIKFKRLISKAGKDISSGIRESIYHLLDENLRDTLWG